jgi:4-methylaminobutanoate oxidase (formaldehyde-forming)
VTSEWLASGSFEVDVAGERHAVRPSLKAPLA